PIVHRHRRTQRSPCIRGRTARADHVPGGDSDGTAQYVRHYLCHLTWTDTAATSGQVIGESERVEAVPGGKGDGFIQCTNEVGGLSRQRHSRELASNIRVHKRGALTRLGEK